MTYMSTEVAQGVPTHHFIPVDPAQHSACSKFKFCFLELSGITPHPQIILIPGWLNPLVKTRPYGGFMGLF